MTTPVSSPLAKLLKEKGFDKYCGSGYTETGDKYLHQGGQEPVCNGQSYYEGRDYIGGKFYCSAPTIAEVVMWIYEKHGIWVNVGLYIHLGNVSRFQFTLEQQKFKSINSIVKLNINPFNSPTEAYEAAIEYCLTKLI